MSISVILGGDLCPVGRAEPVLTGAGSLLDDALEREWFAADLRVANLEAPLTGCITPIRKTGPALKASPDCFCGLKRLRMDILGMANNHILDYGERGLSDTLDGAKAVAIQTVGAGMNADEAERFLITEVNGVRVAFAAFAEHEWSVAGSRTGGANPWSAIGFVRMLSRYKGQYDRLIVLFHGGKEYYEYPPPALQESCRFMVEEGADAVICQHSHCVGSYEMYRDSLIVYGQGNFVFDRTVRDERSWSTGMLVKLDLAEKPLSFSFVPYTQFGETPQVCAMKSDDKDLFLKNLDTRSRKLSDPDFIEQEWIRFCKKNGPAYLSAVLGQGTFIRRLNRLVPLNRFLYPKQNLRAVLNAVRCESLKDTVLTYLENRKDLS
jgi:poly-gamma-glutamate synthesis protein (capsule biosynthesis protein)